MMRLGTIDLIKYGKFENEGLPFPAAPADFHVIVGPNEAGKSTIRTAVSELLFGMKHNSPLGYHHGISELRIGGKLESEAGTLDFHRVRGRSTLRTPSDEKLPEDALAAYLFGATRDLFEQMFGLDHARLVQGGRSILDASDKIGQVLFESAVGIGSLGPVREALEARAAEIWSARGKNNQYGIAETALNQATADMKAALVRTKDWHQRKVNFDELCGEIDQIRGTLRELEFKRTRLERVRRLAPILKGLSEKESVLALLGTIIELPSDAVNRLHTAQQVIATSAGVLDARTADLTSHKSDLAKLVSDEATLELEVEIEELGKLRGLCINHPRDILVRQAELKTFQRDAASAASQLGWPGEEKLLRAALPSSLSIKTMNSLLRGHGEIKSALQNAKEVFEDRQGELIDTREQLASLREDAIPDSLASALSEARIFKNYSGTELALEKDIASNKLTVETSLHALGQWHMPVEDLKKLDVPSSERLLVLQKEESEFKSAIEAARQIVLVTKDEVERLSLQIKHFSQNNKVVTGSEVQEARDQRDAVWSDIKTGTLRLGDASPVFDNAIRLADELVDTKLTTTEKAALLQTYRQGLETAESNLKHKESEFQNRELALAHFQSSWIALAEKAGVPQMVLDDMPAWMRKRDHAIAAQVVLESKQGELAQLRDAVGRRREVLRKALLEIGLGKENDSLATLIETAERYVQSIDRIGAQRVGLLERVTQSQRAVQTAEARYAAATKEMAKWSEQWTTALTVAKLADACPDLATAEAAMGLVESIETNLKAALGPTGRIEGMQSDLKKLEEQGKRLAAQLDPSLLSIGDHFEIARRLVERLSTAQETKRTMLRISEEILSTEKKVKDVQEEIHVSESQVKPLLDRAGVSSLVDCIPIAEKSNRHRVLNEEVKKARLDLVHDGDGLSFDQIEAEVLEFDISQVPGLIEQTKTSIAELSEKLAALLERQVTEKQDFETINGQPNAAIAEARRHEALAAIGDAAEQFIELATAQRLLRWAIERYRDQKQGPMLRRASEIFSGLTLGEFTKLVVESDTIPPELFAKRGNGRLVAVSGLSEGTRDQLFLALRIAALEVQIASKIALPFIADDLLVNFDDERAKAGLEALKELSKKTQVIFLTHHDHLLPIVKEVFGVNVNVIELRREPELAGSQLPD